MKTKTIYSFLTTTGFRTPDIFAYNPKQAYKIGKTQPYSMIMTRTYIKYDQDGLAPIDSWKRLNEGRAQI